MSRQSFQNFFERNISKDLSSIEKKIKEYKQKYILFSVIISILLTIPIYAFLYQYYSITLISLLLVLFIFAVSLKIAQIPEELRLEYKRAVIQKIIKKIDSDFQFNAHKSVPRHEVIRSKLISTNMTDLMGEDHISGKVDKTAFYMSEIKAMYIQRREGDATEWKETLFNGIFFVADFHKNFNQQTFILPKKTPGVFRPVANKLGNLNFITPPLVKLENTQFEKLFSVHCKDQTEARYLLSSAMIENILNIQKKFKKRISVSFVHSKVCIAIPLTKNWLEPLFWKTSANYRQLEDYHDTLNKIIDIIHDMNLNRRIWTKE